MSNVKLTVAQGLLTSAYKLTTMAQTQVNEFVAANPTLQPQIKIDFEPLVNMIQVAKGQLGVASGPAVIPALKKKYK
jgi:hypothetical protein